MGKTLFHPQGWLAIVVSRFNQTITEALLKGALDRLSELSIAKDHVKIVWVPGAVEIPLVAQQLAQSAQYQAVIGMGAVIRGDTDHYDYVCQQVSWGCQRVALEYHIPVIFAVLTTHTVEQAWARVGGDQGHKGRESVDAAMEMISLMEELRLMDKA